MGKRSEVRRQLEQRQARRELAARERRMITRTRTGFLSKKQTDAELKRGGW